MFEFFSQLFTTQQFMPHGHCFLWFPDVLWLHVISDAIIALSYYSIPIALVYFASKRPDVDFRWLLLLFGAFICLCGTTHLVAILTMWEPVYRLEGILKAMTALVSLVTAVLLWPLLPKALKIPSPSQLQQANDELRKLNSALKIEIAERELAENQLLDYARKLEQSNEELRNFAHVASHDLQEPLRKIQLFGDRLEGRVTGNIDPTSMQCITRMRDSASRMSKLISDMLDYARVTTKAQPHTKVDLNIIAADALSDLEARIQETSGTVEIDKLPTIMADSRQMHQLFQNLISNALKFHKPGKTPKVRVYTELQPRDSRSCKIVVEDDGIGFEERYLPKIFTPFQRLHSAGEFEGTGIGLAVCRKIAERHHGDITASSQPGKGSRFIVTLDMTKAEPAGDEVSTEDFSFSGVATAPAA